MLPVRKAEEGQGMVLGEGLTPLFLVSGLTFASVIIAKHAEFYDVVKGHFHLCPLLM